jgi:hypothetical protein
VGSQRLKPGQALFPKLLQSVNEIGALFLRDGSPWLRWDEQKLLEKACRQTRLDDFGDESFRAPLRILLQSFQQDARLSIIGLICVHSEMVRLLSNRLRLVADAKRYPAIEDEPIGRPLFITGLPRSGTTFLHALLAQDPAHRAPQTWEVMYPSPPPEKASYESDPRIAKTARQLKLLDVLMPEFKTVHLIDAKLPQECIAITGHDFRSHVFESMYAVYSYRSWFDRQDKRPAYEFHRRFLQHLQWRCPGKRWVLKAPSHLLALEALLQVYPDAGIILTHRDPLKVLASCASFTEVLRRAFSNHIDKKTLGREVRDRWEEGAGLAIEHRRRRSDGASLDVLYSDLVRDPMMVVGRIYEKFGLELSREAEAAMRRFVAENPKNKGGVHRYSLEEFGLDPESERRKFQPYLDFFGIEPEV